MARIADKHGLTNKYRPIGLGKRVVKRGRPRKYLFGPPSRRHKKITHKKITHPKITSETIAKKEYNLTPQDYKIAFLCMVAILLLIVFIVTIAIVSTTGSMSSKPNHLLTDYYAGRLYYKLIT